MSSFAGFISALHGATLSNRDVFSHLTDVTEEMVFV